MIIHVLDHRVTCIHPTMHTCFVLTVKTYDWAKHGLLAPSQELFELCSGFEKIALSHLEKLSSGLDVTKNLKDAVDIGLNLSSYKLDFVCDNHQNHMRNERIDLLARTRIHHFVRIRNRELQEFEHSRRNKENRKAKKVTHH
jgi:hypothetical protein